MLNVYTLKDNEKWDSIVKSFKNYDTYWLSGYVKAFEINGDGTPLLFYYDDCVTRAVNVVMKRDISDDTNFSGLINSDTYFDFATPYGYGGWLFEGENTIKVFDEYNLWCKNNNIISEFVRFHPVIGNHTQCYGFYDVIKLGNVITMDISSDDIIWSNLTSKNRNMIRKAQKNDIKILISSEADVFSEFRRIYNSTMDKDNADSYYYFDSDFYHSIRNDLKDNAFIICAEKDNLIIAASIMLIANGKMNYHLSGSLREYSSLAPTNLILYEAAKWGSEHGFSSLYLGGGVGSVEDGLLKFKRSFNRNAVDTHFYIGKKIFNEDVYEKLISLRNDINNSGFFPGYRA